MKKNINLKIVILFFLIGVVLILGLGASYIYMLNQLEIIGTEQANVELIQSINAQISQTKLAIIISLAIYSVISILIGFFVAKALVFPMKKLIKSAEKIASGEKIKKGEGTQNNSEVGDLENAFSIMTDELQQKFSEVNRQKKQIETILLHITDGIIAFDIDGKILHINPAAKELLELEETDDSFDKIFNKLDI